MMPRPTQQCSTFIDAEPRLTSSPPQDDDVCWICLDPATPECSLNPMPCKCPRFAHEKCIARWQLQSAGTRKETHCEFCDAPLPDWKQAFKLPAASRAVTIMNVTFGGVTAGFEVEPGESGYRKFTRDVHAAFNLPRGRDLAITFRCDEPSLDSSARLTLQGERAFDAAVHCTALAAARHGANYEPTQRPAHPDRPTIARRCSLHIQSWKKRLSIALSDVRTSDLFVL